MSNARADGDPGAQGRPFLRMRKTGESWYETRDDTEGAMADLNGGALLARCLANEGVRFVFGLPSPEIDPLLAALETHGMRLVPVRHEAAGAHMAEGLYKTTGEVAAVIGNPGPGSANLLAGVITARHEGVPMLAITSQHRLGIVYPSPPSTFQGQDQLDVYRPVVKWGGPIFAWDRIPEVVRLAFREMWTGRPGPVHLELPAPVLYATGDESTVRVAAPVTYRAASPEASEARIADVAALLAGAARPLVVAGSGVDRAGANEALVALVERLGCPVITSMAGRAVVPVDHPNAVYGLGAGGDLAKREADVVLVAGSRLGNLDLPYDKYWGDPASQRIIQIDVDPRHIGVTRPVALGIVADVRQALQALVARLDARPRNGDFLARCRRAADAWWTEQMRVVEAWSGPGLHPARVMQTIGKTFGREAIYVTDGGFTSLWAYWMLPPTRPRSYLSILELGMLGTGIPSALGAKLGSPDREVVCVTGDGAAGFHFMEMQSAARERAKMTVVVFAEGSWSMEVPNEQMLYGRNFGTEMGTVRWDVVARGLGCEGFYAETLPEVETALGRARDATGPAVVCVRTDRTANLGVPPEAGIRFAEVYQGPM
jgi:acetolactate synthase-1/2/3 large subunit